MVLDVNWMIETPQGRKKRKTLVLHRHTYDMLHHIRDWLVHDDYSPLT